MDLDPNALLFVGPLVMADQYVVGVPHGSLVGAFNRAKHVASTLVVGAPLADGSHSLALRPA